MFELKRPSLLATLLWGLGISIWVIMAYAMIKQLIWVSSVEDLLLVFVGVVCGLNSMSVGFLIDMHSLEYKGTRFVIQRRRHEKRE